MINITVKGIADIAKIIGERGELKVTLPSDSTIVDLLHHLNNQLGEQFFKRVYDEKNEVRKNLRLLLNGQDLMFLNGLETKLSDGDRFSLIPPISGG